MVEFQVNGKTRGMKFGTYTFQLINQIAGQQLTVAEIFDKLTTGVVGFSTIFYLACAQHYAKSKKVPIDFEDVDVADWMDDLGATEAARVTGELLKAYTEKNLPAPTTGQVEEPQMSPQ